MPFKRRELQSGNKTTSYKKRSKRKIKKKGSLGFARVMRKIIVYGLLFFIIVGGGATFVLYKKYIEPLPAISELENLEIAQSSIIYDRDGNELYSIFKEKRTYIGYGDINQNMVHAIVAGEDKRFFENPGIDFIGLIRAVLQRVTGERDSLGGTSTLTQQLIRNTIIKNEKTAERKIKEMYLAYKLTNEVSKEKILELYLNKISFGSNAYGIEQAAQTFFGKSAKDIGVLESSILASLPKGPTYYSPYNHYDRVLGYPYLYASGDNENTTNIISKKDTILHAEAVEALKNFITGWKLQRFSDSKALLCGLEKTKLKQYISVDGDGCSVMDYSKFLSLLNGIKIDMGESSILEYQTGRKDFILQRMLEDDYITFDQYKESLIEAIGYTFEEYSENIKYPHFVFFIREYLERKYSKELIEQGGLRIYTSLDPKLQNKAQEIVEKQAEINASKYDAHNAALITIDNETGEILAMVGGVDYFDQENKGNVNIITSRLQPGSTFKPFVYSMAVDKEIIGTKTPVYDVKTVFPGGYTPNNFDGKFMGKMTIIKALNHSRNIPAIKMFYLAGGEQAIISFMEKLGTTTLSDFKKEYFGNYEKEYSYGASMALGTGLMTPLEMVQAYSVYANMGKKKELVPITKILDSKGLIIEEFIPEDNEGEEVLDPSTAFITNYMLSSTEERPEFWNKYLSLSGRKVAAKTGTSTKQFVSGGKKQIYPRNLWTIGYTPQYTTVVWAGNTDGKELNYKGNGLEGAGPIWREFMDYIHIGEPVKNWSKPGGVKEVPISKISGYLVPDSYNANLITSSLFVNAPKEYDTNLQTVEVDVLCQGPISENTPPEGIKQVTLLAFHSLKPKNANWENPVQAWVAKGEFSDDILGLKNTIAYIKPEACERPDGESKMQIATTTKDGDNMIVGANYIELAYRSNHPVISIEAYLGNEKIKTITIPKKLEGTYRGELFVAKGFSGKTPLRLRVIDTYYYSQDVLVNINVTGRDPYPPKIIVSNPSDLSIKLYKGDFFNLKGTIEDKGIIRSINIYIDNIPEKIGLKGRKFNYPIGGENLSKGIHTIRIEAVDNDLKTGKVEVVLEVLPPQGGIINSSLGEAISETEGE